MDAKNNDELTNALAILLRHLTPSQGDVRTMPPEPWLTVSEAATYAQVKEATIHKWIRAGLRAGHVGRILRLRREDLDTWLLVGGAADSKGAETLPPPPKSRAMAESIVKGLK